MISIIVPTYNVEKYIHISIKSLLKQTYSNIEIICIDDASSDSTLDILKYYQNQDLRIKLLTNKSNKGPGYSRNRGLDVAKGKYIFFLDADDWLSPNALEVLYEKSEELNLELLIYKAIVYYDKEDKYFGNESVYDMIKMHNYDNKIIDLSQNKNVFDYAISSAPWNKLYNKEFLNKNNIRFPNENLIQEDEAFFFNVLIHAKKVSFLNKYLINRRRRSNSIMTLTNERIIDNVKIANIMLDHLTKDKDLYEIHKYSGLNYIFRMLNGKYFNIDDEFKPKFYEGIKSVYQLAYDKYGIKEDILQYVNPHILKQFNQID